MALGPFKVTDFEFSGAIAQDVLVLGATTTSPSTLTLRTGTGQELKFHRGTENKLTFKDWSSGAENMIYHEGNVTVSAVEPTASDGKDGDFWWVHE